MSSNPWYAHYPGDYGRDTAHLSLVQHGAYRLLLDHYYATSAALPPDAAALYRICRAFKQSERNAVDYVVSQFFDLHDGGYHNSRADAEIVKRNEHHERLSTGARKTNEKRWGNRSASRPAVACPQPQPQPKEEKKEERAAPSTLVPVGLWLEFVEMRNKLRKPMTARAAELIHRKLAKLKAEGNDMVEVVEQSIRNGWQDVFAVKQEKNSNAKTESFADRNIRRAQEELGEVSRRAQQVLQEVGGDLPEPSHGCAGGRVLPGSIKRPDA